MHLSVSYCAVSPVFISAHEYGVFVVQTYYLRYSFGAAFKSLAESSRVARDKVYRSDQLGRTSRPCHATRSFPAVTCVQLLVYHLLIPYYLVLARRLALADVHAYCGIPPGVHEYSWGGGLFLFCRHNHLKSQNVLV